MDSSSTGGRIILSDNLPVLQAMSAGSVGLICVDPPFNTGRIQSRIRIRVERDALAGLSHQHGGAEGRDTAWLSVSPDDVHPWMDDFGGDLGTAMRRLRTLVGLR